MSTQETGEDNCSEVALLQSFGEEMVGVKLPVCSLVSEVGLLNPP